MILRALRAARPPASPLGVRGNLRSPPRRELFGRQQPPASPVRTAISGAVLVAAGTFLVVYYLDSRSSLHRYGITPLVRSLFDAETGQKIAVRVLRSGLAPRDTLKDDQRLKTTLWDEELSNPIGLAAGFDKNGEAINGLFNLGFGWVEIGSVTPDPQPGNPTPRVFHLTEDSALINRYGFPSHGAVAVLANLRSRVKNPEEQSNASLQEGRILAVNLGKMKTSPPESFDDFLKGIRTFGPWADVLVINVSSPNTPGLRDLQTRGMLEELIVATTTERDKITGRKPKLCIKIAPDLDQEQLRDIASAIVGEPGIDGVIVSNTTVQRPPGLTSDNKTETGGLSGPPLLPLSLKLVKDLRSQLPTSIPIIGCGGISSGKDAIEFAKAGASSVQIYTSFGYGGVGTARRIKDEVVAELTALGTTWDQLTKAAVDQLAPKSVSVVKRPASQGKKEKEKEESVADLIKEAERIMVLLDKLEATM